MTPREQLSLDSAFLNNVVQATGDHKASRPPIYVVTPDSFNATLLPRELEKVDNTVAGGMTQSSRQGTGAREKVLGTKEDRPDVNSALRHKDMRQCASCKELKELKDLRICSQ